MRFLARITRPTREIIEAAIAQSGLEAVEAVLVTAVQPLLPPPVDDSVMSEPSQSADED